jgi:hypothetical protein
VGSPLPEEDWPTRSLVEAWQADEPRPHEVRRAYRRFLNRRRSPNGRAGALPVVRWVLVGVVLGMGSVYAATQPLQLFASDPASGDGDASVRTPASKSSVRAGAPPGDDASPAPARAVPSASQLNPVPSLPTPSSSASEQWQRAARGLREKDFATADAALDELARQGSAAERESARLVRAQLLIAQGRDREASSALRELASSASSLSVKHKATALLTRMNESLPSRRSFEPVEGTNRP